MLSEDKISKRRKTLLYSKKCTNALGKCLNALRKCQKTDGPSAKEHLSHKSHKLSMSSRRVFNGWAMDRFIRVATPYMYYRKTPPCYSGGNVF